MRDPREVGASASWFAAISRDLMSDADEQATLRRICERAVESIDGIDLCGITVRLRRGRLGTLASTDPVADLCDRLQYELGEGPCVDSALAGEPFLIGSLRTETRWPAWAARVEDEGVHGLVSVELPAPGWHPRAPRLGALNLYACREGAVDSTTLEQARVFGIHAGHALGAARTIGSLEKAVEGRHRIGVAQGMLIARYGLDVERSFDLLERYAASLGLKVREIAAHVITTGDLPSATAPDGAPEGAGPTG